VQLDEPGRVQELELIEFELTCIFEGNSSLLGVGKTGYYTWVCGVELLLTSADPLLPIRHPHLEYSTSGRGFGYECSTSTRLSGEPVSTLSSLTKIYPSDVCISGLFQRRFAWTLI